MIASGRVAYLTRRAADYGVHVGPVSVEMAIVRQRKQQIVDDFRNGSQRRIETTEGLDLIFGEARFSGPKLLEVQMKSGETRTISADLIFINTGLRPAVPAIEGIDKVATLNSTTIMELDRVPEHLLVLGGGYVGLEFGQLFRRLGSEVTIIQRAAALLSREDPDVIETIAQILGEDGIDVLLETAAVRVSQLGNSIALVVRTPAGERTLQGSHLLVATGRVPNTEALNLSAASVQIDPHGYIQVNERLETNVPGIYALGDVNGGPAFTHISYDDFRNIRTNLLEGGHASTTGRLMPYTIFIDPQLGRIGLSEQAAYQQGRNIRVAKLPMSHVARALEVNETRGFLKAVVDADTQQILGFTALGIEGGEIMSMVQLAMMGQLAYPVLRDGVFAHPTLAEALNNLFMQLDG
jgi:pyruvate/2-oxoglutarate dehydrogenase complex dihydrolipoamide dehydrogenase (E3) component